MILPVHIVICIAVTLAVVLAELYHYLNRHIAVDFETYDEQIVRLAPNDSITDSTENSKFVRNWIITLTDFDGFTSGALLLRLLGQDTSIAFSSPRSLLKNLKNRGSGLMHGDSIYIADLAMQPQQEHQFFDVLIAMKNKGIKVYWFDHHEWPAGLIQRISEVCKHLIVETSVKTAAELIRDTLPEDDEHADRLMAFVQNRSNEADKEWDRIWRYALSELSHRRDPVLSDRVLRIWADNKPGGMVRAQLARRGYKREKLTEEIALHQHRRIKTNHGRTFLVIDVRSRRLEMNTKGKLLHVVNGAQPSMMVGRTACQDQHADFCLIVWTDFRYSVYRGLDKSVDFNKLLGEQEINDIPYRIAGHNYAVSVQVSPGMLQRISSVFRFRPGPEIENLITRLSECL